MGCRAETLAHRGEKENLFFCKLMSSFWNNYRTTYLCLEKYSAIWLPLYLQYQWKEEEEEEEE